MSVSGETQQIELTVVDREGSEHRLKAREGQSLMVVLNQAGLGIDGICGGCCICATCHIYVEGPQEDLPPVEADEAMLLDGLLAYEAKSRLACQLSVAPALVGQRICIAPAE